MTEQSSKPDSGQSQMGYGNARDDQGAMEQDFRAENVDGSLDVPQIDSAQPGELSTRPDVKARADAGRPLDGS